MLQHAIDAISAIDLAIAMPALAVVVDQFGVTRQAGEVLVEAALAELEVVSAGPLVGGPVDDFLGAVPSDGVGEGADGRGGVVDEAGCRGHAVVVEAAVGGGGDEGGVRVGCLGG